MELNLTLSLAPFLSRDQEGRGPVQFLQGLPALSSQRQGPAPMRQPGLKRRQQNSRPHACPPRPARPAHRSQRVSRCPAGGPSDESLPLWRNGVWKGRRGTPTLALQLCDSRKSFNLGA